MVLHMAHTDGALEGKWAMSCISTGGRKEVYSADGKNRYTINQFLAPFIQSASLCRMTNLPPFVVHGSHTLNGDQIKKYADDYKSVIKLLRDNKIETERLNSMEYMNEIIEHDA